jgi:hypothetical protein
VSDEIVTVHGVRVLRCGTDGPRLTAGTAVADLLGLAFGHAAEVVVVPLARLDPGFFTLRTGIAGEVVQKFVQYGRHLVVEGDLTDHLVRSAALRDFVREANRGRQTWFVADAAELAARLGPPRPGPDPATASPPAGGTRC